MMGSNDLELSHNLAGILRGEACDLNESGQITHDQEVCGKFPNRIGLLQWSPMVSWETHWGRVALLAGVFPA